MKKTFTRRQPAVGKGLFGNRAFRFPAIRGSLANIEPLLHGEDAESVPPRRRGAGLAVSVWEAHACESFHVQVG